MNVKLSSEHKKDPITGSAAVYRILQSILLRENAMRRVQEHFWVMGFNNAEKLLFVELVTLGTDNRVFVKPPEVFRMAIYKTATRVILAHNHPSGVAFPSQADKAFTDRLLKAGKIIEIDVVDHLIITDTDYYSFEDFGLMHELRNNGNLEIVDKQQRIAMELMRVEMAREKAERETKLQVAAKLKSEGMDEKFIKKITGLRMAEIRRLED